MKENNGHQPTLQDGKSLIRVGSTVALIVSFTTGDRARTYPEGARGVVKKRVHPHMFEVKMDHPAGTKYSLDIIYVPRDFVKPCENGDPH